MMSPNACRSLLLSGGVVFPMLAQAQIVYWESSDSSAVEGDTIELVLRRNLPDSLSPTVFISIDQVGQLVASVPNSVTFMEGDSVVSLHVVINNDTICDGSSLRQVTFRVDSVHGGYSLQGDTTHIISVIDDDGVDFLNAGSDPPLGCLNLDSVQLSADPLRSGWSGQWSVQVGSGNFLSANSPNTTFLPSGPGEVTLRWSISNSGCAVEVEVTLRVVEPMEASIGANAQTICTGDSTDPLGGNTPYGWIGSWSSIGGSFTDSSDGNARFSYAGDADTVLLTWTLLDSLGVCPESSADLVIGIVQRPVAEITPDSSWACLADTIDIVANVPGSGQAGSWYLIGDGAWLLDSSSASVRFTSDSSGIFKLNWTVRDTMGYCPSATDSVVVLVRPVPNAGESASLTVCSNGQAVDLFERLGDRAQTGGEWSGPDSIANGLYFPLSMDPGLYIYTVVDEPPCVHTDTASIRVYEVDAPQPLDVSDIRSVDEIPFCTGQYTTLFVSDPVDGLTYTWTCSGCTNDTLVGPAVEVHWVADSLSYAVTASTGECYSEATIVEMETRAGQVSCPQGIVFFEPYGLAILDPLADQFQWGRINSEGFFEPKIGSTSQTVFGPGVLTDSDVTPYYAVRTRQGNGCWTTTTRWKDQVEHDDCLPQEIVSQQGALSVEVSPNPVVSAEMLVALAGVRSEERVEVGLFANDGRLVHQEVHWTSQQLRILLDRTSIPSGLYFLRVQNNGAWAMTRVMIH